MRRPSAPPHIPIRTPAVAATDLRAAEGAAGIGRREARYATQRGRPEVSSAHPRHGRAGCASASRRANHRRGASLGGRIPLRAPAVGATDHGRLYWVRFFRAGALENHEYAGTIKRAFLLQEPIEITCSTADGSSTSQAGTVSPLPRLCNPDALRDTSLDLPSTLASPVHQDRLDASQQPQHGSPARYHS
jgi:hypothetical protein